MTAAETQELIRTERIRELFEAELLRFEREHPRSAAASKRARRFLLGGVPMPFMAEWPGPFPVFAAGAQGSEVTDLDGNSYIDLCLGDAGAMTGHTPDVIADQIAEIYRRGSTHMLPTDDAAWIAEELSRRFSLPCWQFALSATDANRFALRLARQITGRQRVLVFNWCYHGTVDETQVLGNDVAARPRLANAGLPVDPALTTTVVEFNDIEAVTRALESEEVACVIAEPAMTNVGIVLPEPGYHDALRRVTRDTGTLLLLDETHTLCAGPGGCTAEWGLEPDLVVIGKPIASGLAGAAYGMSEAVASDPALRFDPEQGVTGGVGGTLAANALTMSVMRLTLEKVLTPAAFDHASELAEHYERAVAGVIQDARLPWTIVRLGSRAEYRFRSTRARNGGESSRDENRPLSRLLHLYALNRGVLLTPFHNMALMAPTTTRAQVDLAVEIFAEAVGEVTRT